MSYKYNPIRVTKNLLKGIVRATTYYLINVDSKDEYVKLARQWALIRIK